MAILNKNLLAILWRTDRGKSGGRTSSGVKSGLLEMLTKLRILKKISYWLELSPSSRDG